ncbi:MAG: histidine kinase dimerization/phosphoacceptor domain -containing protein, partial [Pseudomonadota bacterium]
ERFKAHLSVRPLSGPDGRIIGYVSLSSEAAALEKDLQSANATREKLEAAFRGLPVPSSVWQRSGDDFILIDYNLRSLEITEGRIVELVGVAAKDLFQARPDVLDDFERCYTEKTDVRRETSYCFQTTGKEKQVIGSYAFLPPDYVVMSIEDVTEIRQAEEALRREEARLEALLRLSRMSGASLEEIAQSALKEALKLTGSEIGFVRFLSDDESEYWFSTAAQVEGQKCTVFQPKHQATDQAGLWAEAVRKRRTLMVNDYRLSHPSKKGLPQKHFPLERLLAVPLFQGTKIVAVAAVGNKPTDYIESDARQLNLLMDGMCMYADRNRTEEILRAALREKEILLREIHHRVKNNMQVVSSLLNLQAASIKDKNVLALFQECQNRVRAMALIHEIIYQSSSLAEIDLEPYAARLGRTLINTYGAGAQGLVLTVQAPEIKLDLEYAIPCGLIINELVSNSIKYAFPQGGPGNISLTASRFSDDQLKLVIADDGVGLPPQLDWRCSGTLGLSLVVNLAEQQLRGRITLSRARGAKFTVRFKPESKMSRGR